MSSQKNIVIICSRLDVPGGIERAIVNTANLFAAEGHRVFLLVLEDSGEPFFTLDKAVEIAKNPLTFGINGNGNLFSRKLDLWRDVNTLNGLLKALSPDLVIATEYSYAVALVLAYRRAGVPLYSWEHHHFGHLRKNKFWSVLQKRLYPKLSAAICLNKAEAAHYTALHCKTTVIPNYGQQGHRSALEEKNILTVGWLSKTKGVDFIPALAEKVFAEAAGWQWTIVGTGEEEQALKSELRKRNLHQHVHILHPASNDLSSVYTNSSLYVMTSRFECFPMVLLEAASHGLPCVAFDCPTGPRFIIDHNTDGLLIEPSDVDAMAAAVVNLIQDEEKRKAFGKAAYQNITRFSPDKIYALWEKKVLNALAKD